MHTCLVGWLVAWLVGWLVSCLLACLLGWLVGCMLACLLAWLVVCVLTFSLARSLACLIACLLVFLVCFAFLFWFSLLGWFARLARLNTRNSTKRRLSASFGWVSGVQLTCPGLLELLGLPVGLNFFLFLIGVFWAWFFEKNSDYLLKTWSWAWFFKNTRTWCDFEMDQSTLQLHQTFKHIKILTCTKRYTDLINIYFKLTHTRFWAVLKKLLGSSFLPPFLPSFLTTSMRGES